MPLLLSRNSPARGLARPSGTPGRQHPPYRVSRHWIGRLAELLREKFAVGLRGLPYAAVYPLKRILGYHLASIGTPFHGSPTALFRDQAAYFHDSIVLGLLHSENPAKRRRTSASAISQCRGLRPP